MGHDIDYHRSVDYHQHVILDLDSHGYYGAQVSGFSMGAFHVVLYLRYGSYKSIYNS